MTELNKKKVVNGQIDEPLAPEGIEQAGEAVSLLPESIKQIYSSPLQRTRQTAEIINLKLNRPISFPEELTEIHMGSLAGKAWTEMEEGEELKKKHRTIQFDYRAHGGESAKEVKKRVISFLKKINGKHGDFEVLIVTHGGIICTLYWLEYGKHIGFDIEHLSPRIIDLEKILEFR